jgi:hypothetical protein
MFEKKRALLYFGYLLELHAEIWRFFLSLKKKHFGILVTRKPKKTLFLGSLKRKIANLWS